MKSNKELKNRCLDFFKALNNEKFNYYLIIDKKSKNLYKIKIKKKKIYFLGYSAKRGLLSQLKELFPKKNFDLKEYDFMFIKIFSKHNTIILGLEKEYPDLIMWNNGIYEI